MTRDFKRAIVFGSAGAGVLLAALVLFVVSGLPPRAEVHALAKKDPKATALMRQREEEAAARGSRPRRVQAWVPLWRVSRNLIQAVVASEDQRFFEHRGVDWMAVRESLGKNVEAGRVARGGSTITQQLAKNLFFGTRKTLLRKLREIIVARWIEEELTKPRILEIYLNVIEWGDGTYGCEAAARHWYGVEAADLARSEAAGLAAMIPNPRRINPRVSPQGHERLTRRVLWLMGLGRSIAYDVARLGADPPPEASPEAGVPLAPEEYAIPPELEADLYLGGDEAEPGPEEDAIPEQVEPVPESQARPSPSEDEVPDEEAVAPEPGDDAPAREDEVPPGPEDPNPSPPLPAVPQAPPPDEGIGTGRDTDPPARSDAPPSP